MAKIIENQSKPSSIVILWTLALMWKTLPKSSSSRGAARTELRAWRNGFTATLSNTFLARLVDENTLHIQFVGSKKGQVEFGSKDKMGRKKEGKWPAPEGWPARTEWPPCHRRRRRRRRSNKSLYCGKRTRLEWMCTHSLTRSTLWSCPLSSADDIAGHRSCPTAKGGLEKSAGGESGSPMSRHCYSGKKVRSWAEPYYLNLAPLDDALQRSRKYITTTIRKKPVLFRQKGIRVRH